MRKTEYIARFAWEKIMQVWYGLRLVFSIIFAFAGAHLASERSMGEEEEFLDV